MSCDPAIPASCDGLPPGTIEPPWHPSPGPGEPPCHITGTCGGVPEPISLPDEERRKKEEEERKERERRKYCKQLLIDVEDRYQKCMDDAELAFYNCKILFANQGAGAGIVELVMGDCKTWREEDEGRCEKTQAKEKATAEGACQ